MEIYYAGLNWKVIDVSLCSWVNWLTDCLALPALPHTHFLTVFPTLTPLKWLCPRLMLLYCRFVFTAITSQMPVGHLTEGLHTVLFIWILGDHIFDGFFENLFHSTYRCASLSDAHLG